MFPQMAVISSAPVGTAAATAEEEVACRALTVARRTALGVLGDREGVGVALSYHDRGGAAASYRIVFDPGTSEILEWSVGTRERIEGPAAWQPDRVETVLETGYVDAIGDRP